MQPPLTYSWIALTASAPVILLLTCWTLAVFHCRRRQWGTMDVFLVAILSQSIFQQFLGFVYSSLVLLKLSTQVTGEAICGGMMWFFIAIPIFKGSTIISLGVDRYLYNQKFSYRLSIRKNLVRYHIFVLAILSCIVGFTALITFNNPELLVSTSLSSSSLGIGIASSSQQPQYYSFDQCTFLPFKFDVKFVIFYLSIHCIVILIGVIVLCKTLLCHKNRGSNNHTTNSSQHILPSHHHAKKLQYKRRRSSPTIMDVTPTLSNTSTASSTISNSSPPAFFSTPGLTCKQLLSNSPNHAFLHHQQPPHQQFRNLSRRDFSERITRTYDETNYRLSTALGLLLLTILCTHLAFTIATVLSRLEVLTPISSIGYGSGDPLSPFNWPVTNLLLWLQVIEGLIILLVLFIVDNVVPTWIFNRTKKAMDVSPHHSYAIENSSNDKAETSFNPPTNLNNNNRSSGRNVGNQQQQQYQQANYTNHAFTPDFKNNKFPITNGSLFTNGLPTAASTSRPNVMQMSNPVGPHSSTNNGHHRFTQVLDGRMAVNRQSKNGFDSIRATFQEDESEYDRKSYHHRYSSVASVTTVANDDFEFHQSRPSMPHQPQHQRALPIPSNDFNPSTYVVPKSQPLPPPPTLQTFNLKKSKQSIYEEFNTTNRQQYSQQIMQMPQMSRSQTMTGLNQPTSLSMNDLDLIIDSTPATIPSDTSTTTTNNNYTTTEPSEHKQRIYRKRTRLHNHNPARSSIINDRRGSCQQQKPNGDQFNDPSNHRRVLSMSMECLSPSRQKTDDDYRNFLDISYLDTGELYVQKFARKAESSKCVFVTDFI